MPASLSIDHTGAAVNLPPFSNPFPHTQVHLRAGLLAAVVTSLVAAAVVLSVLLVWEIDSRAGAWLVVSGASNKKAQLLKE